MPLPSFTTPPQWLQTPPAYPLLQFNTWGVPGPYPFGGKLFWVLAEASASVAADYDVVAYSNTDPAASQPSTRIAPGSPMKANPAGPAVFYPGSGSLIYVAYVDTSISVFFGVLQFVTFDMSTSTWGTPNSTGVTINGGTSKIGIGTLTIFKLANGNVQIVFDGIANGGVTGQIYASVFDGVSWTTTQLTVGAGNYWKTIGAAAISGNKIGIWYSDFAVQNNIYYSVIDGASLASTATVTTYNHLQINQPITAIYDPVSDTAACLVIRNHFEFVNLLLASPSASTTTSVVTVYDDAPADFEYDTGVIAGNAAGNQFYILLWDSVDNVLHIFGSTALATGWTASPSVFYSQALDPPVSPAPAGPEIFPNYATFLNGTTYAVTSGFLAAVGGDPPFCGVMAAMVPATAPTTGSLELTKIVEGGPALPGSFTLTAVGGTDTISGNGHVGPTEVTPDTYELSEVILSGATWDADSGTWSSDDSTWDGNYVPGPWNCGDAEMPTPTSVVVPPGGVVACTITNTFEGPSPPPPPPPAGTDAVGCFELLRLDVTLMPARHLPTRGSVK